MDRTNPHHYLGLHNDGLLIRLWHPDGGKVYFTLHNKMVEALPGGVAGVFEYALQKKITHLEYRIYYPNGELGYDPYAFLPTFSREDEKLFSRGQHWKLYDVMGGRLCVHQGCEGAKFAVWAPNAQKVSLIGEFNHWNVEMHPMRRMGSSGVWELFIPGLIEGMRYKFALFSLEKGVVYKADPFAFQGEIRPNTASVLRRIDHFDWNDHQWIEGRRRGVDYPINIYEVHLGSWKRKNGDFLQYHEIAVSLAEYVEKMKYTHVELLPVMEHPLDESWGYQVTGFYAISRRYGQVEEFQYFVNYMHSRGIGVILDWVPGHFPIDNHALAQFDGSYLYEHCDPRQGYHPHWKTHIFNYGRWEVANFLIGSALFYIDTMHIDGLRVDAVSSMVYLDFGRKKGEWMPNVKGSNENIEAVRFLRTLNSLVHATYPGVLMIAEESHGYPGVTDSKEGLGFDLKWDLGWMHDTLCYFETPVQQRSMWHKILVHEFTYYFREKHLLPLSHDEVVHEKKSLLSKMVGNEWERFANLRLLHSYMICHPGKKLSFMGGEFGQLHEWACTEELHWDLLQMPYHQKLQQCVAALNTFYLHHSALWEEDFSKDRWAWVDVGDESHALLSYLRKSREETLLCIHHFSNKPLRHYLIPYKGVVQAKELFSTDASEYGGCGMMNPEIPVEKEGLYVHLPSLSTLIIKVTTLS